MQKLLLPLKHLSKPFIYTLFTTTTKLFASQPPCCDDPTHNHHIHQNPLNIISTFTNENFNEKMVCPTFLGILQQSWSQKSEENVIKVYNLIMNNMEKVNNPESIIMIADKTRLVPKRLQTNENKRKILNRACEIFEKLPIKSDKGEKLKSIILVCTLNKYDFQHKFYEKMLVKITDEFEGIQADFLLTIVESLTYNKIPLTNDFLGKSVKLFENLMIKDMKLYPKIVQLFVYRTRNIAELNENALFLPVILSFYNKILNFITKERLLQFTVLILIETMNYLAYYNKIVKNDQEKLFFLYKQLLMKIEGFFEKNSLNKNDFPLKNLITFFSSFSNYKASFLPKKLLIFFERNFGNYKLENLKDLAIYLHFLCRHVENYEISEETLISIRKFIEKENNLMILTKMLEVFYASKPAKTPEILVIHEEILDKIEEKSLRILKRLNYPSAPLLQIYQLLAYLNRGKRENWIFFIEHFSRKHILEELDYQQIIVKLIPTVANKAKQDFKLSTNIAMNMAPVSAYLKNSKEKIELVLALERFWSNLEDFLLPILPKIFINKYPIILMHMVYANLTFRKFVRIHQKLMNPILENLKEFTMKNLSGILYSYSRVLGPCDSEEMIEFFMKISEKLKENQENLREFEWANAFWAFSNSKIYEKKLIKILDENLLEKLGEIHIESFSEYIHSLASFRLGNTEKLNRINEVIIEKLKNKEVSLQISHVFLWAYNLLILEDNSVLLWKTILNYIDSNKNSMKTDDFQYYYLYLLYIHLNSSPELTKELEKELFMIKKILCLEKPAIINQLAVIKPQRVSENETKVIEIIKRKNEILFGKMAKNSEKEANLAKASENTNKIELNYNGNRYIFYDNLKELINEDISADFLENLLIMPYTADYRVNNVIFEFNGKYHYFLDIETKEFVINGPTFLKKQILQTLGLKYVEIPFYLAENEEEIVKFVKKQMDLA